MYDYGFHKLLSFIALGIFLLHTFFFCPRCAIISHKNVTLHAISAFFPCPVCIKFSRSTFLVKCPWNFSQHFLVVSFFVVPIFWKLPRCSHVLSMVFLALVCRISTLSLHVSSEFVRKLSSIQLDPYIAILSLIVTIFSHVLIICLLSIRNPISCIRFRISASQFLFVKMLPR